MAYRQRNTVHFKLAAVFAIIMVKFTLVDFDIIVLSREFLVQVEAEEQKVLKEDQGPLALREKKEKVEDEAKM